MASRALPLFVFSHNDEKTIEPFLSSLDAAIGRAKLDALLLVSPDDPAGTLTSFHPEIHLLANGCKDRTIELADNYAQHRQASVPLTVHRIELGDKGDAWNFAVHTVVGARTDSPILLFLDSDIDLSESKLDALVAQLCRQPRVLASVSEPIKRKRKFDLRSPVAFVLSRSSQGHSDGKICGQLYALRNDIAQKIWLPRGLLVEDGFLAGCINTEMFSHEPEMALIRASHEVHHYFDAEPSMASSVKHEARLELGTHINAMVWPLLWGQGSRSDEFLKAQYTDDPNWLVRRFASAVKTRGLAQFQWSRALEPFTNLRLDAKLPLKTPVAALRSAQRAAALVRAYADAKSERLLW
jgi:hypothetical protein